ncbi:MAG: hypothetical protein ACREPY_01255 [Rhodanobacteraceae bacterium]
MALLLAACHHAPPPPSNVTPEKAVATNLRLTASGDFDGLMKNRLPPADYMVWRQEWDQQHAHPIPISVAQQKQFAKIMQMLTEPGAEAKLMKRFEPEMASLHGGKSQPLPVFASILEAAGKHMVEASPQLGPAQKKMAMQGLDAFIAWAGSVDFSDKAKAKHAIDLACATARQLHVQTLEQWRALDYAATMRDYGIIWNGMESLLGIYGLDLGKSLNAANVTTVSSAGDHAVVKLDMTFADKPLSAQWPMQKVAGHWYDTALLDAWQKAHPAPAASASSAPAPAASAAGAGTTTAPAGSNASASASAAGTRSPQI